MAASWAPISLAGQSTNVGRFEVTADAAIWTAAAGDARLAVALKQVSSAEWLDGGRACALWLRDKSGVLTRFDGFKLAEFDRLSSVLRGAGITLDKASLAVSGRNWGTWGLNGKSLEWRSEGGGTLVASLPLESVAQAAAVGKGEVQVQFMDEDTVEKEDEVLVEMRLFVPAEHELADAAAAATAARKRAAELAERRGAGADEDAEAEAAAKAELIEAAGADAAMQLHALITDAAGVAGVTGDAIAELGEDVGQFLTPRGRFAVELYPSFCRLVGKTFEFKVAYKSIARMFYLPKASPTGDEASKYYFVISLDDPLRHGAQRHALLVMQLDRRPVTVPLNVSDEDVRAGRYDGIGKDSREMSGDLPRVVASLFKHVTGKPIFKPGGFVSARGAEGSVKASLKSNDGALFLLEKSLMFLHKPALWLRYADITLATARRSTGASRTGELALTIKAGTALAAGAASGRAGAEVVFQALDTADLDAVRKYLEARDVPVEEEAHGGGRVGADEDFDGEAAEAAAAAAKKRPAPPRKASGPSKRSKRGDEGSDESAGELPSEEASADEDDDDDDDDSDSDSDSDDEGFNKKKPKKGTKKASEKPKVAKGKGKLPKKKRARRSDDDDDDDDGKDSGSGSDE